MLSFPLVADMGCDTDTTSFHITPALLNSYQITNFDHHPQSSPTYHLKKKETLIVVVVDLNHLMDWRGLNGWWWRRDEGNLRLRVGLRPEVHH